MNGYEYVESEELKLLELAGKALGLKHAATYEGGVDDGFPMPYIKLGKGHYWNPYCDDGDALRTSTSLGLSIERNRYSVQVSRMPTEEEHDSDERGELLSSEPLGVGTLCPHRATRRAIVRAAAEIGKALVAVEK